MYTQPPPERQSNSLPRDELHRTPHPVVSLSIAALLPATLFGISALTNHPRIVVVILLLVVGMATADRLSPAR